jgi:hypothetical protein
MSDDDTIELLARGYTREQIAAIREARADAERAGATGDDNRGPAPRRRRKA